MIRKRLIGAITVRQGIAVQSFGYRRHLPLGKPEVLAVNLDRWGADEIMVASIDRTSASAGPNILLLERIARKELSTPLVYGGGIRSVEDAHAVISSGADRIFCDALLRDDPRMVRKIGDAIGIQAVIGSLPLSICDGQLSWYDYRKGTSDPLTPDLRALIREGAFSELMIGDWRHEGQPEAFEPRLVEIAELGVPLILFGGISSHELATSLLAKEGVAAIAVGNFFAYREHAMQQMRGSVGGVDLRGVEFRNEDW